MPSGGEASGKPGGGDGVLGGGLWPRALPGKLRCTRPSCTQHSCRPPKLRGQPLACPGDEAVHQPLAVAMPGEVASLWGG